jgi:hypothetical protein
MRVLPVRYEHHLYTENKAIPGTDRGGPQMFPMRYEHLHINSKVVSVTGRGDQ